VSKANFGRHIELATPPEIELFAKFLYIVQVTYAPSIAAMKLSVLLFYHRLFAIPSVKIPLVVLGAITIAWFISMVRVLTFSFYLKRTVLIVIFNLGISGYLSLHTNRFFLEQSEDRYLYQSN